MLLIQMLLTMQTLNWFRTLWTLLLLFQNPCKFGKLKSYHICYQIKSVGLQFLPFSNVLHFRNEQSLVNQEMPKKNRTEGDQGQQILYQEKENDSDVDQEYDPLKELDIESDESDKSDNGSAGYKSKGKRGKKRKKSQMLEEHNIDEELGKVLETPQKCSEVEANKTPEKPKEQTTDKFSQNLKLAGRDLGCSTPHSKRPRLDRSFYQNFSMGFHCWAIHADFPLDVNKHGEKTQLLTPEHLESAMKFAGPSGLNLISEKTGSKNLHKMRFKNGARRTERYVGNAESGFVDPDGFHSYPDFCPFQHCHSLPEWFKKNQLLSEDNSSVNKSPSSLAQMKEALAKLKDQNINLKESLDVESKRSSIFMEKLKVTGKEMKQKESHVEGFPCPQCGKVFSRPDSVQKHILKIHPDEQGNLNLPKDVLLPCKYCTKSLASRYVRVHEKACERKQKRNQKQDPIDLRSGYCTYCGVMKARLSEHMKHKHEGKKCYKCENIADKGMCLGCDLPMCTDCSLSDGQFCEQCSIKDKDQGNKR